MEITIGEHQIRDYPSGECYLLAYLSEPNEKTGERTWQTKWYPTTLEHAFKMLAEKELQRTCKPAVETSEVLSAIRGLDADVRALTAVYEAHGGKEGAS